MVKAATELSRAAASAAEIRRRNLAIALQLVHNGGGVMTRAEIARITALTSATVSSLLAELIELGYVRAGDRLASTGGKPPLTFHVNPTDHGLLVLRVESTYIDGAMLDLTGTVVAVRRTEHDAGVPATSVADLATELATASGRRVTACAVEVPGTIDDGVVVHSVQLGWVDVPITSILREAVNAPTFAINDADAGALAELIGADDLEESLLYLHVGRGVGAAIVFGGDLLRGARVGEIGHVRMEFEGSERQCRCGLVGCLEASTSMSALLGEEHYERLDRGDLDQLLRSGPVTETIDHGSRILARAVWLISASLDISTCVVGGDAPLLGVGFIDSLQEELDRHPPRGARPIVARYSRSTNPFIGAAQHALSEALHVRWSSLPANSGTQS